MRMIQMWRGNLNSMINYFIRKQLRENNFERSLVRYLNI